MSSLDDFFAKKDKRKKGKNKNYVTSESLVKTIEEHQAPQPVVTEQQEGKAKIDFPAAPTQEDEWKEEEEPIQDFEGLRVHKLDKDDGEESEKVAQVEEEEDNGEEKEIVSRDTSSSSPWQSVTPQQPAPDDPDPDQQPQLDDLPNVQGNVYVPPGSREGAEGGGRGGGAYVPPGARGGGGSGAYVPPHLKRGAREGGGGGVYVPPGVRGSGRGTRLPPDLKSAVAFPSLQGVAKKGEGSSSERGADFKEVQGPKSSRSSDTTYHAPGLELTNKFSVLDEN